MLVKDDAKLVSIIIPAYNVENYIDECLDSILAQTCSNWEAIVIDDGSVDNTWQHIQNYQQKDSRIHGFHRDNSGVSAARNFALQQVKGDYIQFVDSDDYIVPDAIEIMLKAISGNNADWVNFHYQAIDDDKQPLDTFGFMEGFVATNTNDQKLELIIDKLMDYKIGYEVWTKLYKASIIKKHHICFPEDCHIGEDLEFNLCYSLYASGINCIKERLYYYRVRSGSAMDSIDNLSKAFTERLQLLSAFYETYNKAIAEDADDVFYKIFYRLMMDSSRGYTALDTVQIAREKNSSFYLKWLKESLKHQSEIKALYPKEKANLFYYFGLYIYANLKCDIASKIHLGLYSGYRKIKNHPPIQEWEMT